MKTKDQLILEQKYAEVARGHVIDLELVVDRIADELPGWFKMDVDEGRDETGRKLRLLRPLMSKLYQDQEHGEVTMTDVKQYTKDPEILQLFSELGRTGDAPEL